MTSRFTRSSRPDDGGELARLATARAEEGDSSALQFLDAVARYEQLGTDRSRALRDALEQLPPDQSEVLVLRDLVGLSPEEIARCLGRTEASVQSLHDRGRGALRQTLRELEAARLTSGS
jgi:RNA polymerase sigma factor (sigma-70 family)